MKPTLNLTPEQLAKIAREQRLEANKKNKRYIPKDQRDQSTGVVAPAGSKPKPN